MVRDEIIRRLERVFRAVFDDDTLALRAEMTAADVDGWDSLAHITLIVSIEKEFGIELSPARMARLSNVGEMIEILAAHAKG
jgi:acyl carrier protein